MDSYNWIIIISTLVCSAFFSGTEIAFLSANKLAIELESKQGKLSARILSFFLKRPSKFIGVLLLGNNISLVIYGIYMAIVLEPFIAENVTSNAGLVLLIQTIFSTLLILITAEFLPKTIFRINPNRILNLFAVILAVAYGILWLPMIITIFISEGLLKLFVKDQITEDDLAFGRVDLDNYVRESTLGQKSDEEVDHEIQIFQNAMDFSKVKARDCMVPRTEIIALDIEEDISKLKELFISKGLSKVLIYRDNIDNIIGFAHAFEMFKNPESIKSILMPIGIVPESKPANDILEEFTKENRSIAIVVDEFGGTSGMLTIEDIMEEIFGEIEDEHDQEDLIENQISEDKYELSARHEVDYLNEKYNLNIPESDEYETLSGYIISQTEDIPSVNETIETTLFSIEIKDASETKIDCIYLTVKDRD